MENLRITNTPYDDVFRTLLNDCSPLIIPIINAVFGERYSGEEEIVFSPNEHFQIFLNTIPRLPLMKGRLKEIPLR